MDEARLLNSVKNSNEDLLNLLSDRHSTYSDQTIYNILNDNDVKQKFATLLDQYPKPNQASNQKIKSNTMKLLDTIDLTQSLVDAILKVSSMLDLDECVAFKIVELYLVRHGTNISANSDKEKIAADIMNKLSDVLEVYYIERYTMLEAAESLVRIASNSYDQKQHICRNLIDSLKIQDVAWNQYKASCAQDLPGDMLKQEQQEQWVLTRLIEQMHYLRLLIVLHFDSYDCTTERLLDMLTTFKDQKFRGGQASVRNASRSNSSEIDKYRKNIEETAVILLLSSIHLEHMSTNLRDVQFQPSDNPYNLISHAQETPKIQAFFEELAKDVNRVQRPFAPVVVAWYCTVNWGKCYSNTSLPVSSVDVSSLLELCQQLDFLDYLVQLTKGSVFSASNVSSEAKYAIKNLVGAMHTQLSVHQSENYERLIDIVCSTLQNEPKIIDHFWSNDFDQQTGLYSMLRALLDRFPHHSKPLVQILKILLGDPQHNFVSRVIDLLDHMTTFMTRDVPTQFVRADSADVVFTLQRIANWCITIPEGTKGTPEPEDVSLVKWEVDYSFWPILYISWTNFLKAITDGTWDHSEGKLSTLIEYIDLLSSMIELLPNITPALEDFGDYASANKGSAKANNRDDSHPVGWTLSLLIDTMVALSNVNAPGDQMAKILSTLQHLFVFCQENGFQFSLGRYSPEQIFSTILHIHDDESTEYSSTRSALNLMLQIIQNRTPLMDIALDYVMNCVRINNMKVYETVFQVLTVALMTRETYILDKFDANGVVEKLNYVLNIDNKRCQNLHIVVEEDRFSTSSGIEDIRGAVHSALELMNVLLENALYYSRLSSIADIKYETVAALFAYVTDPQWSFSAFKCLSKIVLIWENEQKQPQIAQYLSSRYEVVKSRMMNDFLDNLEDFSERSSYYCWFLALCAKQQRNFVLYMLTSTGTKCGEKFHDIVKKLLRQNSHMSGTVSQEFKMRFCSLLVLLEEIYIYSDNYMQVIREFRTDGQFLTSLVSGFFNLNKIDSDDLFNSIHSLHSLKCMCNILSHEALEEKSKQAMAEFLSERNIKKYVRLMTHDINHPILFESASEYSLYPVRTRSNWNIMKFNCYGYGVNFAVHQVNDACIEYNREFSLTTAKLAALEDFLLLLTVVTLDNGKPLSVDTRECVLFSGMSPKSAVEHWGLQLLSKTWKGVLGAKAIANETLIQFLQGKFKLLMILCNILNNYKTEGKSNGTSSKTDESVQALFTRIYIGIPDFYYHNQHNHSTEFFSFCLCFYNLMDEYEIAVDVRHSTMMIGLILNNIGNSPCPAHPILLLEQLNRYDYGYPEHYYNLMRPILSLAVNGTEAQCLALLKFSKGFAQQPAGATLLMNSNILASINTCPFIAAGVEYSRPVWCWSMMVILQIMDSLTEEPGVSRSVQQQFLVPFEQRVVDIMRTYNKQLSLDYLSELNLLCGILFRMAQRIPVQELCILDLDRLLNLDAYTPQTEFEYQIRQKKQKEDQKPASHSARFCGRGTILDRPTPAPMEVEHGLRNEPNMYLILVQNQLLQILLHYLSFNERLEDPQLLIVGRFALDMLSFWDKNSASVQKILKEGNSYLLSTEAAIQTGSLSSSWLMSWHEMNQWLNYLFEACLVFSVSSQVKGRFVDMISVWKRLNGEDRLTEWALAQLGGIKNSRF